MLIEANKKEIASSPSAPRNDRNWVSGSLSVGCLRKVCQGYLDLERGIDRLYQNSLVHKLFQALWQGTKISFRYSFLGRITEIDDAPKPDVLGNSKFVGWLLKRYVELSRAAVNCFANSLSADYTGSLRRDLSSLPLRTGGTIAVVAIAVNVVLSLLFHKEINSWGWFMRALFFSLGLAGLSSTIGWQEIEKTSEVLNYFKTIKSEGE